MQSNRAVFLDRDGVICEDVHYLKDPNQLRLLPNVEDAIRLLNEKDWKIIVITNQSGVARGYITLEDLRRIHQKMLTKLRESGAFVHAIYFCPHHPTIGLEPYRKECNCRKPKPGMLFQAAKDFNIDLKRSFMIGDKIIDIQAGKEAGCLTILISSDRSKIVSDLKADFIAPNLYEASKIILNMM
ncbi:MAG: D-glycero-alpha-D-manno-heptose-1,7-bisphosphate 7-phosphatase [Candidatus Baldrarchaeia archaeon]